MEIKDKIAQMLEDNKLSDLKKFLKTRSRLNKINIILLYLFHIFQSSGILITTISPSLPNISYLLYIGISLNALASLFHVFETMNVQILKKLMTDIENITSNNYIDETSIIKSKTQILPNTTHENFVLEV